MKTALQKILFSKEHRLERRILMAILFGLVITFAIQISSQKSIDDLLASDEKVMYNYELDNYLGDLDRNLIALESNLRSYVIYEAAGLLADIGANIAGARQNLEHIRRMEAANPGGSTRLGLLDTLVEAKILFSESVLDSFTTAGVEAAFSLLSTQNGLLLRDSIIQITNRMRQQEKQAITRTIQANRKEALRVGTIDYISTVLAVLTVALAVIFFLKSVEKHAAIQEKLEEARRNAEQSAMVKEQFLANMSHEIRTPLNAILAYSNILQRAGLSSHQQECAQGIRQAGDTLLALVNDILDTSKFEAGMIRLERIPFSISGLLHSLESMFRPKADSKGINLRIYPLRAGQDILLGDPTRLTQVLSNLLSNAVKFTDEGGVQAWSSLQPLEGGRVLLEFRVQDTGIGIPEESMGQVFERFGQGGLDIPRRYGGTGLGLSIVKNLVEAQGGSISIKSTAGAGATFTLKIPFELAEEAHVLPAYRPEEVSTLAGYRILVVEDNPMNQRITELILREWGLSYSLVKSGRQALAQLKEQPYHLILMDIQLPELDGYSTAWAIREKLQLDVPIIAMTAQAMDGERERCLSNGMNGYISKPVREELLLQMLKKYLPGPGLKIDLEYLASISGGKPERIREMAGIFLQQAPIELAALEEALREGQQEALARAAHKMRSTAAYMGLADSLGQLLEQLETAARENAPDQEKLSQLTDGVRSCTRKAMEAVEQQIVAAPAPKGGPFTEGNTALTE